MIVRSRGLLAAASLCLIAAAPLSAQQKFGYVDSRKILQEMPGRTLVEASLRTRIEALGAREKRMADSLSVMMTMFQSDSAKLTQPEKIARFTALQAYDAQYRDTLEVLQAEAEQQQQEAMAPLFDQIRMALEDIRQAEGLSMIFDIGAQVNPLVAMDKNLDLSDRVIARIRTMPTARATTVPATRPVTPPRPAGPVSQPVGVRKP